MSLKKVKSSINKLKIKKVNSVVLFGSVLVVIFIMKTLKDNYRMRVLQNSYKTYAIVYSGPSGGTTTGLVMRVSFKNKFNISITTSCEGNLKKCRSGIKKGDTVYIKYSLIDNDVAELINCYWNNELREDMNNQKKR